MWVARNAFRFEHTTPDARRVLVKSVATFRAMSRCIKLRRPLSY